MVEQVAATIEHKAYARIGHLGNPSDVYNGNTISLSIANFWATVKLDPSDQLVIRPHLIHDLVQFDSIDHLVNRLQSEGYCGGVRLLMAICKTFYKYCKAKNIALHGGNFTLSYDTNIPCQTGLSGSSAIVCAALNCILDFYKVRHLVKVEERPNLILEAEKELGIVAGLQDRVVQVYGGLVFMDFDKSHLDRLGHGIYTQMDISLLPPLYLIYVENPSDSGKVHSTVRQRWLDRDDFIRSTMNEVSNLAVEGRQALLAKDYAKLASLMNRNFDLRRIKKACDVNYDTRSLHFAAPYPCRRQHSTDRVWDKCRTFIQNLTKQGRKRSMFGDDALGALNVKMVEVPRGLGAASKFTGSGGAVVAFCPDGPEQATRLDDACKKAGFIVLPVQVVPSLLTEADLNISSS